MKSDSRRLLVRVANLEQRTGMLTAVLRLVLALLHVCGFELERSRLAQESTRLDPFRIRNDHEAIIAGSIGCLRLLLSGIMIGLLSIVRHAPRESNG